MMVAFSSQIKADTQLMQSIATIEAHEEELSPIYWPQQYQEEPLPLKSYDLEETLLAFLSYNKANTQLLQSIVMSAQYCIFKPLNLHLLII